MKLPRPESSDRYKQSIPLTPIYAAGVPLNPRITTLILMGKTGVGKSSFIKLLGGRDLKNGQEPEIGSGIDSCTSETTVYKTTINEKEVMLVDTPGFDDTAKENLQLLHDIISYLYSLAAGRNRVQIHGIVFLHDISEIRFSGTQRKAFSILRMICGEECMGNVIVGTTRWNRTNPPEFLEQEKRENAILDTHWSGIFKTTRLFCNDRSAATEIVTDLLAKSSVLLLVQKEMLEPPNSIENTTVGRRVIIPETLREIEERRIEFEENKTTEEHFPKTAEDATDRKIGEEIIILEALLKKFKTRSDLSFAEKLGLAVAAPLILAPAAVISAPLGLIAALVHLAKKMSG